LYFDNTSQGMLSRIAIDKVSGAVSGVVEVLASGIQPDDFVLGDGNLIWIAQNSRNTISVLLKNGTVVNVAGSTNSLLVPDPSACEFGKEDKLFCTSTGGQISQVNGTFVGGEILEIDTRYFEL
jgi:sugar lactone lactonase YvrE